MTAAFPLQKVPLSGGISLDVAVAGTPGTPPIILLHGFPESHRTWRHQIAELAQDHFVLAPDQRGYGGSDKPSGVEQYAPQLLIADIVALADAFGIDRFTLVGHDWGGAIAWGAAITRPDRVERLIILNAPHPLIFQRSLFEDQEQRAASQYMRAFRSADADARIAAVGLGQYLAETIGGLVRNPALTQDDLAHYQDYWSRPGAPAAMLNWYRASPMIVPAVDETCERPAMLDAAFPKLKMPVLVIWGMKDVALKPCQIEGLDQLIDDLTLIPIHAGHFTPWEAPDAVNAAMRAWLAG